MKTKKCGVFAALAAVLLLSAVLITSCPESFNLGGLTPPQVNEQTPFTPPPGMGYVMLNFGDGPGRTIRPDTSGFVTNAQGFAKFDVEFTVPTTPGVGTPQSASFSTDGGGTAYAKLTANAFALVTGTYNIEVWAYKTTAATSKTGAAAYGISSAPLAVTSGVGDSASITLKEITTNAHGGTGTLTLNLTNPTSSASTYINPATTITMTITSWPGDGATSFTDIPILAPAVTGPSPVEAIDILQSSVSQLSPGVYRVALTLSGGTRWLSKTISEVLHIYQGLNSTYTDNLPTISRYIYDVKFTYGDSRTGDGGSKNSVGTSEEVEHGDSLTAPGDPLNKWVTNPTGPVYDATKTLESWHTNSSLSDGTLFSFSAPILRDTNLFAKWKITGVIIGVTYNPSGGTGHVPVLSVVNDDDDEPFGGLTSLVSPPTIRISFNNDAGYYTNIRWVHTVDDPTKKLDLSAYDDIASFTIDLADPANIIFLTAGSHRIDVSMDYDVDSSNPPPPDYESTYVQFTVAE